VVTRDADELGRDILLWAAPTFVLNVVLTHGDVVQAALVAALVAAVGVPLERRLTRD
jgi:hypothetical protein